MHHTPENTSHDRISRHFPILGSHKGLNYIMRESLFSSQVCENKDLLTSSKSTIYVTVTLGMDKGIRTTILYLHSRQVNLLRVNLNQLSHMTFTYCQVSQKRFQFPAKTTRKKLKNVSVGKLLDPSPLVYTIGISCNCSQKHPRGKKKEREGAPAARLKLEKASLLSAARGVRTAGQLKQEGSGGVYGGWGSLRPDSRLHSSRGGRPAPAPHIGGEAPRRLVAP